MNKKNGVEVIVRIRPLRNGERRALDVDARKRISIRVGEISSGRQKMESFDDFDTVLGETSTQCDVFETCKSIVHTVVNNDKDGAILAYGQTSSGKTHTLMGSLDNSDSAEKWGIVPRTVYELFSLINEKEHNNLSLSLSVVEIYNEQVRDLLHPSKGNLKIVEDTSGNVSLPGMTELPLNSETQFFKVMKTAIDSRATNATRMNDLSSRSHCLVIIHIAKWTRDGKTARTLCLADLAGSERQKRTKTEGLASKEAQYINKSLLVLGSVLNALNQGHVSQRIPYRDSKLTRLIQGALGGTSATAVIICCSPADLDSADTISSLHFGARAKNIKMNIHSIKLIEKDSSNRKTTAIIEDKDESNTIDLHEIGVISKSVSGPESYLKENQCLSCMLFQLSLRKWMRLSLIWTFYLCTQILISKFQYLMNTHCACEN